MSYVYMKALESAPERYDKGINWLGWGKLGEIRSHIFDLIEGEGNKVLEIGVGTGTQALLLAERGLQVIGIDNSPKMLSVAQKKLESKRKEGEDDAQAASRIELQLKAAVELDTFPANSFDVVTSTLVFSELHDSEQKYVLAQAFRILKPGGALILADEVLPSSKLKRGLHALIASPLKFITFLITQTTTKPVHNLNKKVEDAGFTIQKIENYQLDSFRLIHAKKPKDIDPNLKKLASLKFEPIDPPTRGIFSTFWQTAMRIVGHETEIGLIPCGNPTPDRPVLCTCNFKLTVQRLYDLLKKKKIDAWILVTPTDGINVWCAACGDIFNAESVITAIKISSLEKYVNHRTIILPQLGASGIDPKKVKKVTGWECIWGPVNMEDLPEFLENLPNSVRNKTERQRSVRFNTKNRLEMASSFVLPFLLVLTLPLFLALYFLNLWIWTLPILATIAIHVYFVFLFWPIIPTRLGTSKVVIGSIIFLALISGGSWYVTEYLQNHILTAASFHGLLAIFNWWPLQILALILMIFLIYDADGMTPTLRSSLGARSWNKGKLTMLERWGSSYQLTPYGKISINLEQCTGCGVCMDVCPMLIPVIEKKKKKVSLRKPNYCVNCRACVIRCPTNALLLAPETEAAKIALEKYQKINNQ